MAQPLALLLLGGGEWQPGTEAADAWWLTHADRPVVTVVTTAAQDGPERALAVAARHYAALGATVLGCRIQTPADASDPARLAELERAAAIYLCGGDPGAARRVLVGSPAAAGLARAAARIPIAGSSAGAMVLAGVCLLPGRGTAAPGLGYLPGTAVAPHWDQADDRWRRRVARLVGGGVACLGIDERTGLGWDRGGWRVLGPGGAEVLPAAAAAAGRPDLPGTAPVLPSGSGPGP